jgi:anti-sigma B factor antagonist
MRWTVTSSGLQVESKKKGKAVVVAIGGDAGMAFVGQLQQELSRVLEGKPELVVLDLTDLTFISSMGMGTLVNFRNGVGKVGGTVKLAALKPLLAEAFRRARLTEMFEICESVDAAMTSKPTPAASPSATTSTSEKPKAAKKTK